MLSICLIGLNTRYSHENLAIKYLKESAKGKENVQIYDFTINDRKEEIIRTIISNSYSHIGFSAYIWNIEFIKEIIVDLKTIDPNLIIFAGGPEVSHEWKDLISHYPIDYLLLGEGEKVFNDLIEVFKGAENLSSSIVSKSTYQDQDEFEVAVVKDFSEIPNLYLDDSYISENKYVYYEASRGCPYSCTYCLSSAEKALRYKDLNIVKEELSKLIEMKVDLVKFIDRSFNANPFQTEIVRHIIEKDLGHTSFHLEIHPSLIKESTVDLLKSARCDLFQFEIGLQTTNPKTAKEIRRVGTFEEIKNHANQIIKTGAHVHMDLIAGLPFETYKSFKKSFNDLYRIGPDKIQLGFLKLLRGTSLRNKKELYGYKVSEFAPYEIFSNNWISYKEILKIKVIEDTVEKYYNEGYFKSTIQFLISKYYPSPWSFFEELSSFWERNSYLYANISRVNLYNIMIDFLIEEDLLTDYIKNLLIYDYYSSGNRPSSIFKLNKHNQRPKKETVLRIIRDNLDDEGKFLGIKENQVLKNSVIEVFDRSFTNDKKNFGKHYYFFSRNKGNIIVKGFRIEETI